MRSVLFCGLLLREACCWLSIVSGCVLCFVVVCGWLCVFIVCYVLRVIRRCSFFVVSWCCLVAGLRCLVLFCCLSLFDVVSLC